MGKLIDLIFSFEASINSRQALLVYAHTQIYKCMHKRINKNRFCSINRPHAMLIACNNIKLKSKNSTSLSRTPPPRLLV